MLEPGTPAPDFTLPNQDGEDVTLSSLEGKTAVVYFYPKADTTGCTTQACSIRDHAAHDAVVLGCRPTGGQGAEVPRQARHDARR